MGTDAERGVSEGDEAVRNNKNFEKLCELGKVAGAVCVGIDGDLSDMVE